VPSVVFTITIYLLMSCYYRCNCIHICRVWYELFEKQIRYYTLFRVLRWEFASIYISLDTQKYILILFKSQVFISVEKIV